MRDHDAVIVLLTVPLLYFSLIMKRRPSGGVGIKHVMNVRRNKHYAINQIAQPASDKLESENLTWQRNDATYPINDFIRPFAKQRVPQI